MLHKLIKEKYGSVDRLIEKFPSLPSRATVYRIINNEVNPSFNFVLEISKALGITAEQFMTYLKESEDETELDQGK